MTPQKLKLSKAEIDARTAAVDTLADARDAQPRHSVVWLFCEHAIEHLFESWLSDSFGIPVRITGFDSEGMWIDEAKPAN